MLGRKDVWLQIYHEVVFHCLLSFSAGNDLRTWLSKHLSVKKNRNATKLLVLQSITWQVTLLTLVQLHQQALERSLLVARYHLAASIVLIFTLPILLCTKVSIPLTAAPARRHES